MNLFSYIDKYGDYSFEEMEFTEVDNIIFSSLAYVNLNGIVSSNKYKKLTIKEVGDKYFEMYPGKKRDLLAIRRAVKMLRYIKDTKRYGNLLLYNYVYEKGREQQFGALSIEINKNLVYISFEGTDHVIGGWKEDFMMTYMFPVSSQKKAIEYVNRNFFFSNKKIILGGHSKGGNLALVAGMYANFLIRERIIKVYNNDGPGLLKEHYESKYYSKVKSKLIHIIPNYSVIGLLLLHDDDYIVVRSAKKGALAHDLNNWVVKGAEMMRTELDSFSKALDKEIIKWLRKYERRERKRFVFAMFSIFERANIESLIDVFDNKKLILNLISKSKDLSIEDRKMLKDFIGMLFKCFKDVKKEELMSFIDRKNPFKKVNNQSEIGKK